MTLATGWEEPPESEAGVIPVAANSGPVAQWFAQKFPKLPAEFGDAVLKEPDRSGQLVVSDICQPFLAATLGEHGTADAPTVYLPAENRFWTYSPEEGVYTETREPALLIRLSRLLLDAARACDGAVTNKLEFGFRDSASLTGVVKHAQGLLAKPHDYFDVGLTEFIPCRNGMLRLSDKKLLPFSPSYRRRNKLAVAFDPAATCPLFLDTLMRPALDADDLDLLQRACGLFLIGENLAQRILLLAGTAGGGKGTFVRVLVGIIGANNVGALRHTAFGRSIRVGAFSWQDPPLWRGRSGQFFEPPRREHSQGPYRRGYSDARIQKQQ